MKQALDDKLVELVAERAAEWGGLLLSTMTPDMVRRALRAELDRGASLEQLHRRAVESEPELMRAVRDQVTVRETYFFRNPDQFDAIERIAYQQLAAGRPELRVWCAGCATGEEAYSLAATLLAVTRDGARVGVLATDVHAGALEVARKATYRRTSIRASGPILHPVLEPPGPDGVARVLDDVRAIVTFELHDLREPPPPPGHFDLIVCRNVLVYFARPIAREVCARIASALAPDGVAVFSAMDLDASEVPMLARTGNAEHQTFRLPPRSVPRVVPVRARTRPLTEPPDHVDAAIEAHRAALLLVERGRRQEADRALRELVHRHPGYVPGLVERALFDARHGDTAAAVTRMRSVLEAVSALGPEVLIAGIEDLPASFYVITAREFLRRHEGGG